MNELENRVKEIFAQAQEAPVQMNPYFVTKILAHLDESQPKVSRLRPFFYIGPIAAAALVFIYFNPFHSSFHASVYQPVLVKVEVKEISPLAVAYAEVQLPQGVSFYSKQHPEIETQKNLVISWDHAFEKSRLPIVIRSSEPGVKVLNLQFRNENGELVTKKEIKIQFKESA